MPCYAESNKPENETKKANAQYDRSESKFHKGSPKGTGKSTE